MKHPSRRELREKLLAHYRRQWNVSDDEKPLHVVEDEPVEITFWDDPSRPSHLGRVVALSVWVGGVMAAFAVGIVVGYLWTLR